MQNLYIAIIDDDEDDVSLLKECFKKYKSIACKGYSTGQKFLDDPFEDGIPCLLVVDLNLPDIRGIDLIDLVKANPLLANIPIIVCTTDYSRTEQINCDDLKITLLKKPDTILEWDEIALMMARHCDQSL
jgi:CheY-like chemotaxis protein